MHEYKTVGDLRKLLNKYPDYMLLEIYDGYRVCGLATAWTSPIEKKGQPKSLALTLSIDGAPYLDEDDKDK